MRHAELRERVCEANRGLVEAGLVVLSFGNASGIDRDAVGLWFGATPRHELGRTVPDRMKDVHPFRPAKMVRRGLAGALRRASRDCVEHGFMAAL
jgi:hypothetical protein